MVALRQGGVLSYLFSDHLGSTTVTTDSSGTKTAEMRYKPWGETRYSSGTTPTAKHYTGQYEESGIGLYFYNARWYDPLLGRFAQADTLIPQPGNPLAWDRYAYTSNNPINRIDPSGHVEVCADGDICDYNNEVSVEKYADIIENEYGIILGYSIRSWNIEQASSIFHSLVELESGLERITRENGKNWINKNLGGTSILQVGNLNLDFVLRKTVFIDSKFEKINWNSLDGTLEATFIHEFGHVWDNKSGGILDASIFGGGYGDALMDYAKGVPGNPLSLRYLGGIEFANPDISRFSSFPAGVNYGNNSTADYFAHTFTGTILGKNNLIPDLAGMWMGALISLTK